MRPALSMLGWYTGVTNLIKGGSKGNRCGMETASVNIPLSYTVPEGPCMCTYSPLCVRRRECCLPWAETRMQDVQMLHATFPKVTTHAMIVMLTRICAVSSSILLATGHAQTPGGGSSTNSFSSRAILAASTFIVQTLPDEYGYDRCGLFRCNVSVSSSSCRVSDVEGI